MRKKKSEKILKIYCQSKKYILLYYLVAVPKMEKAGVKIK